MISLDEKTVTLGDVGEISVRGFAVNRIRTKVGELDISTIRLPNSEYETMILNASGKRVDVVVGRRENLSEALQCHFDYMHLSMALFNAMPKDPDTELFLSGELERNYRGQWIAYSNGKVLAHGESLGELAGKEYINDKGKFCPTFHWVPRSIND